MKYLVFFIISFVSIQINAQNSFTVIYKYKIDNLLKDSVSFDLVKPLGTSVIGEDPFYQMRINKFQRVDSLCEISCSYSIPDTTCALILEGFGHESFAIPNDTLEIMVIPKPLSENGTPQFSKYDFIYSGKNSAIYGLFDKLEQKEGSLRFSSIGMNNSNNAIQDYFFAVKEKYLKRLEFLNQYFSNYSIPDIFRKLAVSEITSIYYDNLYSITFEKQYKKNRYAAFPEEYLSVLNKVKFTDNALYFNTMFYQKTAYSNFLYNAAKADSVNAFESDTGFKKAYVLIKENCPDSMKSDLLTHFFEWNASKKIKSYDSLYREFSSTCTNEKYTNFIDKVIVKARKKNKDQESITKEFALNTKIVSYKGKLTNIESILSKNKITILDCWATWCVPCVKQIPYVDKFKNEFKSKVEFVYLSFDHDSSQWVNKESLIGSKSQSYLVDSNFKSDFAKFFEIYSIPRYIIFSKEGKVLNDNAPRPSNEIEFRDLVDKLINSSVKIGGTVND